MAREEAPKTVHAALKHIRKAVEKNDSENSTADALKVLQEAVQKLAGRIDAHTTRTDTSGPAGASFATVAICGAAGAPYRAEAKLNPRTQYQPGTKEKSCSTG